MHRIVHFDLKGAPPKITFFEKVLEFIKACGATGVLLEWEDTFPYSENLVHLGSSSNASGDEMYSMCEVQRILAVCRHLGLEAIQLVQTIGHMEFVLKHPCHEHLRECPDMAALLCPSQEESLRLVRDMVMQALAAQPDAKYFHIGADEVWHMGLCVHCKPRVSRPCDAWRLYLRHVSDLAGLLRALRPGLAVLVWDDMLRPMTPEVLAEFKVGELLQPVVWNYNVLEEFGFSPPMWHMYQRTFPTVWAASAFKGASGQKAVVCEVARYKSNHLAWREEMIRLSQTINFAGVILTGWSRYCHFAPLCELLPASVSSLASCLAVLGGSNVSDGDTCADEILAREQWPALSGMAVSLGSVRKQYDLIQHEMAALDLPQAVLQAQDSASGSPMQFAVVLRHDAAQLEIIGTKCNSLLGELESLILMISLDLNRLFGRRTVNEWLQTYLVPLAAGVKEMQYTCADEILAREQWPALSGVAVSLGSVRKQYDLIQHEMAALDLPQAVLQAQDSASGSPMQFAVVLRHDAAQLEIIGTKCNSLLGELESLILMISLDLNRLFGRRTVNEWLQTYLVPLAAGVKEMQCKVALAKEGRLQHTPSVA